jgi:hypothetical protein
MYVHNQYPYKILHTCDIIQQLSQTVNNGFKKEQKITHFWRVQQLRKLLVSTSQTRTPAMLVLLLLDTTEVTQAYEKIRPVVQQLTVFQRTGAD